MQLYLSHYQGLASYQLVSPSTRVTSAKSDKKWQRKSSDEQGRSQCGMCKERRDSGLLKQPLLKGHGHMMVCNRAGRRLLEQVTNIFHISKKYIQYIYDKYCSYFQQQERKVRVTCNREKGLRVQEQVTGQDRPSISSNDPYYYYYYYLVVLLIHLL